MITSSGNERIRAVRALTKRAKARNDRDAFVVEGIKMFREAPKGLIQEAYVTESFLKQHGTSLPAETREQFLRGGNYEIVSEGAFATMSDTQTPQGILCVVRRQHWQSADLLGKVQDIGSAGNSAPLLLVLEDIQDPGNLGTILRTAEGAGATGVLMSRGTADIYNPKVIRSTMGSIYRVPFIYTDHLQESICALKDKGLRICAAHLKGRVTYDEMNYQTGTAFLIGNESRGLKEKTAALADVYVRIPMLGQVESLNAAMAAGIFVYEAARQRRGGKNDE